MAFRKRNRNPKPGDIVINKNNKAEYANNHPLLQHSADSAFVMTTKEKPSSGDSTYKVNNNDAVGFDAGSSYVTSREVTNTEGIKIGKLKPSALNRIKQWFLNL